MSNFTLLLDWEGFEKDKYVHTVLEDNLLPAFLVKCHWFSGKNRNNWRLKIGQVIRMTLDENQYFFSTLEVKYAEGYNETYLLTLSFVEGDATEINQDWVISAATLDEKEGFLVEGVFDEKFRDAIYQNILKNTSIGQKNNGNLVFEKDQKIDLTEYEQSGLSPAVLVNTAFEFDDKYYFKLYRKISEGLNPEVEMLQYFSEHTEFANVPNFCGSITWKKDDEVNFTFGVLMEKIAAEKDNWSNTGDYLNDFLFAFVEGNFQVKEHVFGKVALLGKRTAQMHEALFTHKAEEGFRAEQFDRQYRRQIHHKLEDLIEDRYALLTECYMDLDEQSQKYAWKFMESKDLIIEFIDQILTKPIKSFRIRNHGDFHLGQVLVSNDNLVIIDFEGEAELKNGERKIKHSALKDVAYMIRSYHYAVSAKLYNSDETKSLNTRILQRASDRWFKLMRDTFLSEYLNYFGTFHPLLNSNNEINYLLQFHLLEKSILELGYEIKNRPDWVKIPLKGINDVIMEIEKLNR